MYILIRYMTFDIYPPNGGHLWPKTWQKWPNCYKMIPTIVIKKSTEKVI